MPSRATGGTDARSALDNEASDDPRRDLTSDARVLVRGTVVGDLADSRALRVTELSGANDEVLSHGRRRLVHFNVTEHPTAEWTARQLLEVCVHEEARRYLIRDRDQSCRRTSSTTTRCGRHLSLGKDAPEPRSVQPPAQGRVVEVPRVGGLHHEYLRRGA